MTRRQVESLLVNYPTMWVSYQYRRELIIYANRSSSDWSGMSIRGGGSYSDPTAKRAILLEKLSFTGDMLAFVGKWIENHLEPRNRPLLLDMWRGYNWATIARRMRKSQWWVMEEWAKMTQSLAEYMETESMKQRRNF